MEIGKTHSDIYAIPSVEGTGKRNLHYVLNKAKMKQKSVYGYINFVNDSGVVVTDGDERARLMRMNLSPVKSKVSNGVNPYPNSQLDFRYLYTGREYNIETSNYYYRARVMDASVGRFSSKDLILYLNRYSYILNKPTIFRDSKGMDFELTFPDWSDYFTYSQSLTNPLTLNLGNWGRTLGGGLIFFGASALIGPKLTLSYVLGTIVGSTIYATAASAHFEDNGMETFNNQFNLAAQRESNNQMWELAGFRNYAYSYLNPICIPRQ